MTGSDRAPSPVQSSAGRGFAAGFFFAAVFGFAAGFRAAGFLGTALAPASFLTAGLRAAGFDGAGASCVAAAAGAGSPSAAAAGSPAGSGGAGRRSPSSCTALRVAELHLGQRGVQVAGLRLAQLALDHAERGAQELDGEARVTEVAQLAPSRR